MNIEISPVEYTRELNWEDGMMYCQLLLIDGKNDWRLPTIEELNDIYNSENDFVDVYYWSSTEYKKNRNYAWSQNFDYDTRTDIEKDGIYCVRAVRTI